MRAPAKTLTTPAALAEAGLVSPESAAGLEGVAGRYAIALTPTVASLINPDDPDDPIARQFVPDPAELITSPEERLDPIGDDAHSPVPGLVHRYPDRVLLKLTHLCPVYCRFCFRRETVGPRQDARQAGMLSAADLTRAIDYINADKKIWEVIFTGGDPLTLSPRRLAEVFEWLVEITHVKVFRIHTRVPTTAPERVTDELLRVLDIACRQARKALYLALHINHVRELSPPALLAITRLADAGIPLLSQTVLLKGVNDSVDALADLMRGLVAARVKPYYLHHPDLAPGTARFRLSIAEGQALVRGLRGRLSGLCQPTYVVDIPGGFGKSPIGPDYLGKASHAGEDGMAQTMIIEDYQGRRHLYPPPGRDGG